MTSHHDVAVVVAGPCVVCGITNYSLSAGGPSICPKCDCGHFDAATVADQSNVIAELRTKIESQAKALSEAETLAFRLNSGEELQSLMRLNNELLARAIAAEARLAEAMKALAAIAEHPKSYNDGKRSYAVGWAFWNVQNIARAFTNAAKEQT